MSYNIIDQTPEEARIARVEKHISRAAASLAGAIFSVNEAYRELWSLADADLISTLNRMGPAKVTELFALNSTHGPALNTAMEAVDLAGRFPRRVEIEPGRLVEWNAELETFEIVEA